MIRYEVPVPADDDVVILHASHSCELDDRYGVPGTARTRGVPGTTTRAPGRTSTGSFAMLVTIPRERRRRAAA